MKPRGGLSTPVVFRHLDYDLLSSKDPEQLLRKFIQHGVTDAEYVNDLELPAFRAMPSLQQMKVELEVRSKSSCPHESKLVHVPCSCVRFLRDMQNLPRVRFVKRLAQIEQTMGLLFCSHELHESITRLAR